MATGLRVIYSGLGRPTYNPASAMAFTRMVHNYEYHQHYIGCGLLVPEPRFAIAVPEAAELMPSAIKFKKDRHYDKNRVGPDCFGPNSLVICFVETLQHYKLLPGWFFSHIEKTVLASVLFNLILRSGIIWADAILKEIIPVSNR